MCRHAACSRTGSSLSFPSLRHGISALLSGVFLRQPAGLSRISLYTHLQADCIGQKVLPCLCVNGPKYINVSISIAISILIDLFWCYDGVCWSYLILSGFTLSPLGISDSLDSIYLPYFLVIKKQRFIYSSHQFNH